MKNFDGFGLSPALGKSLAHMKYTTPTPIQAKAIPIALEGHDIMGSAQTGTGKTAAFAIPLIERLLTNPHGSALVLTPTRELGKQIMDIMHQLLGPKSHIKTAFIIGGESMGKQFSQLRANPRLIVGTPGRINDHLQRKSLKLDDTDFLVLDETDRMLDMGFSVQLERIFKYMPEERQTLMFSATLPKNILKMSDQYLTNPKRIAVGETNVIAKNIKQDVIRIEQDKKYQELTDQLDVRSGSVIVFVKTKHGADRMAKNLRRDGFTSEALHGDLRQNKREKVMQNFRKQNFRVLIATDIAARGLDVPHIEHVVNYDLPQVAEDFIHRMGRTARAGAEGSAISFVSGQDGRKWKAIEQLLNPEAAANDSGFDRGRGGKGKKSFGKKKPFKKNKNKAKDGGFRSDDREERSEKRFDGEKSEKRGKKPFKNRDGDKKPKRFEKSERDDVRFDGEKPAKRGKKPFKKDGDTAFTGKKGKKTKRSEAYKKAQDGEGFKKSKGKGKGKGNGKGDGKGKGKGGEGYKGKRSHAGKPSEGQQRKKAPYRGKKKAA